MPSANCPDALLDQIWREFRSEGITDDLAIIEHLAFFLLVRRVGAWDSLLQHLASAETEPLGESYLTLVKQQWEATTDLIPTVPGRIPAGRWLTIVRLLDDALEQHTPAELLNLCLVPHLSGMLAGGRYPTPRHITQTMARLVALQPGESLADLACGSGGLLVAAARLQPHVTGVEISPNWARIAWTNTILHDLPTPIVRIGNTFAVFHEPRPKPEFDCILMNPPFGEIIDRSLVDEAFGVERYKHMGGRSETLLAAKALDTLKPGGRMAILLPTGLLFAKSMSEAALREGLIGMYQLQAVVTLPQDALQPFTGLQIHLLVIRNPAAGEPGGNQAVWFYRVSHDGFTGGRNRRPEPEKSELPRLEATVLSQSVEPDEIPSVGEQRWIAYRTIRAENTTVGYRFTRHTEGALAVYHLAGIDFRPAGLLATVDAPAPGCHLFIRDGVGYVGLIQSQPLLMNLPARAPVPARYKLSGEDVADYALSIESDRAHILKKGTLYELELHKGESDSRPVLLVVNLDGIPVSPPLAESGSLPKPFHPSSTLAVPLDDDNENTVGHLLIFANATPSSISLNASSGRRLYLVELNGGYLLVWPDDAGLWARIEVTTSTLTFSGDKRHTGVAVDSNGNWFGVQVPAGEIVARDADLQPSTYFPVQVQPQALRSPAEILADIKKKHRQLDQHVDYLLGVAELRPLAGAQLPSPVVAHAQPIGALNQAQQIVWNRIESLVETFTPAQGEPYSVPRPFRIEDVSSGYPIADVQRTLELFERMGLIVRVTIGDAPYYQRVTERDVKSKEVA